VVMAYQTSTGSALSSLCFQSCNQTIERPMSVHWALFGLAVSAGKSPVRGVRFWPRLVWSWSLDEAGYWRGAIPTP